MSASIIAHRYNEYKNPPYDNTHNLIGREPRTTPKYKNVLKHCAEKQKIPSKFKLGILDK